MVNGINTVDALNVWIKKKHFLFSERYATLCFHSQCYFSFPYKYKPNIYLLLCKWWKVLLLYATCNGLETHICLCEHDIRAQTYAAVYTAGAKFHITVLRSVLSLFLVLFLYGSFKTKAEKCKYQFHEDPAMGGELDTGTLFLRYSGRSVELTPPSNAILTIDGASPPVSQHFIFAPWR
jgi:hypothetical protein